VVQFESLGMAERCRSSSKLPFTASFRSGYQHPAACHASRIDVLVGGVIS
jgi:hypothetical protein